MIKTFHSALPKHRVGYDLERFGIEDRSFGRVVHRTHTAKSLKAIKQVDRDAAHRELGEIVLREQTVENMNHRIHGEAPAESVLFNQQDT